MVNGKYIEDARLVFSKTKYCQAGREDDKERLEYEIEKLAANMPIIQQAGLERLHKKLMDCKSRNIWAFIAEYNFAIELLKANPGVPVEYEPDYLSPPPDFVVKKDGITFWMQMKKLSTGERENKRDKIFQAIKEKLSDIGIPKFITIMIAEDFTEDDIEPLVAVIRKKALKKNNKYYRFQYKNRPMKAQFSFVRPRRVKLESLFLGATGDVQMVNVTGLDADQVKNSIRKATNAFTWDCDSSNINLVVMEADNMRNIDVGEACFGTEFMLYQGGRTGWSRKDDGFLNQQDYSSKVAGVIAVRRIESEPIPSGYSKTLFVNERYADSIDAIKQVIDIDEVFHLHDYIPA